MSSSKSSRGKRSGNEKKSKETKENEENETSELLSEDQKQCYLGKCSSLLDFITQEDFSLEDIKENIVFLKLPHKEEWECWNREGFLTVMNDKEKTFVEWTAKPNVGKFSRTEQDQGMGYRPVANPSVFYQQLFINGEQLYILTSSFQKQIGHLRKTMPAFRLEFDSMKRLGNLDGEYGVGAVHGQANRGAPIHPTYTLELVPLKKFREECQADKAEKLASRAKHKQETFKEMETKRQTAAKKHMEEEETKRLEAKQTRDKMYDKIKKVFEKAEELDLIVKEKLSKYNTRTEDEKKQDLNYLKEQTQTIYGNIQELLDADDDDDDDDDDDGEINTMLMHLRSRRSGLEKVFEVPSEFKKKTNAWKKQFEKLEKQFDRASLPGPPDKTEIDAYFQIFDSDKFKSLRSWCTLEERAEIGEQQKFLQEGIETDEEVE